MEKFFEKYLFTSAGRDKVVQVIEYFTTLSALVLIVVLLAAKFL
jgi:hypothetical protein